jgi:hypothetical protein
MALRQTSNRISPDIQAKLKRLGSVPPDAYQFFRKTTPIKSGNARKNTDYDSTETGGTITGDYPYANRLNEGYSRQAPEGMTKPTIAHIRRLVRKILG